MYVEKAFLITKNTLLTNKNILESFLLSQFSFNIQGVFVTRSQTLEVHPKHENIYTMCAKVCLFRDTGRYFSVTFSFLCFYFLKERAFKF